MVTYTYSDLVGTPCLAYIYSYIGYSAMTNKQIASMSWSNSVLSVEWQHPGLDPPDKMVLDAIVTSSLDKKAITIEPEDILAQIFWQAYADGGVMHVMTLCDGLDYVPSFMAALGNHNYPLARARVQKAVDDGKVSVADRDLVFSIVPDREYE